MRKNRIGVIVNDDARPSTYINPDTGQVFNYGEDDGLQPFDPLPKEPEFYNNTGAPAMETTTTAPQYQPPAIVPQFTTAADEPEPKKTNFMPWVIGLGLLYLLTKKR